MKKIATLLTFVLMTVSISVMANESKVSEVIVKRVTITLKLNRDFTVSHSSTASLEEQDVACKKAVSVELNRLKSLYKIDGQMTSFKTPCSWKLNSYGEWTVSKTGSAVFEAIKV